MISAAKVFEDIAAIIEGISGVGIADLSEDTDLLDLGLDSLMFVRIGRRIESSFAVSLTMKQFYDDFSVIGALCGYLQVHSHPDVATNTETVEQAIEPDASAIIAPIPNGAVENQKAGVKRRVAAPILLESPGDTESELDQVMLAHLRLMEQYLSSLTGGGAPIATPADSPPTAPEILAPDNEVLAEPDPDIASMRQRFSGVELERSDLTEQQQAFISELAGTMATRCARSKALAEGGRRHHADWKYSLQFKADLKALRFPIAVERAEGARFWDVDGNEYVDIAMGMGTHFFGHAPKFIDAAVKAQMEKGAALGPQSALAATVAEKLCALTKHDRAAFFVTGSDAVMLALRIARAARNRQKVVIFSGAYHGICSDVLAVQGEVRSVPMAAGVPEGFVDDLIVLDYDDPQSLEIIDQLGPELAAVLVEPVQSRNPTMQPQRFLRQLRSLCTRDEVPLIFDEMVNGFRQSPGGMQEWFGIKSDLSTFGKIIGGGYPLSVVAGNEDLMQWVDGGVWSFDDASMPTLQSTYTGGTHNKHPIALSAANSVLDHIEISRDDYAAVHLLMHQMADRIGVFLEDEAVPMRFSYFGSQFKFESFASSIEQELFFYLLAEQGVYTWELHVANLSTAHSQREVDHIVTAVKAAVRRLREGGFSFRAEKLRRQYYPMSGVQRRLFALTQREGAELPYHLAGVWRLQGALDVARLEDAVHQVIVRHESLRTAFTVVAGEFFQCVVAEPRFSLDQLAWSSDSPEKVLENYIAPFSLREPPLIRVAVSSQGAAEHLLFIDVHHLAADGLSMNIVLQEILALYDGESIASVTCQARHVHRELDHYLLSEEFVMDQRYWRQEIEPYVESHKTFELATDFSRPKVNRFSGERIYRALDRHFLDRLAVFSKQYRVSNFAILLTAFTAWIYCYSRSERFLMGLPSAGRPGEQADTAVGMFVNTLLLPVQFDQTLSIAEFTRVVRDKLYEIQEHGAYPFECLLDALSIPADASRNPLFDVMFSYENAKSRALQANNFSGKTIAQYEGAGMFDVAFDLIEVEGELLVNCAYSKDLFNRATMEGRLEHYFDLLESMLDCSDQPVAAWLQVGLDTDHPAPSRWADLTPSLPDAIDSNCLSLWQKSVASHPQNVALVAGDRQLTFAETDRLARAVAHELRLQCKIVKGDKVIVCLEPSAELCIAMMALFYLGAVYVPITPETPTRRQQIMASQCGAKWVLADSAGMLAESLPSIDITAVLASATQFEATFEADLKGHDPAYIIFTSGTTGVPKGVLVHHAGIHNAVNWRRHALGFSPDDRTLQMPSIAVDGSIMDILSTLASGAALILMSSADKKVLSRVADLVKGERVSHFLVTPSLYRVLLNEVPEVTKNLRFVTVAGEALSPDLAQLHHRLAPSVTLWNEYGPTECSVVATACIVESDTEVTIGSPISGAELLILDEQQRPVPTGVWGQCWIGGVGVALGYVNNDALTLERFTTLPGRGQQRFYDTGDVARYLPSGELAYRGRADAQVKLNGYRVELEEVEGVLLQVLKSQFVAAAVISVSGNEVLHAWLVGGDLPDNWRQQVAQHLPVWMIPAALHKVDSLPLLPSGKLNRSALSAPDRLASSVDEVAAVIGEVGPHAQRFLVVAREVLQVPELSLTDNFFEVGADSIQAIVLASRLREEGIMLDVNAIFIDPKLLAIANTVTSLDTTTLSDEEALPNRVAPMQAWALSQAGAEIDGFSQAAWLSVPSTLTLPQLEKLLVHVMGQHRVFDDLGDIIDAYLGLPEGPAPVKHWVRCSEVEAVEGADAELVHRARSDINLQLGRYATAILVTGEQTRVVLAVHHLLIDAVSWLVLMRQLATTWAAMAAQEPLPFYTAPSMRRYAARLHEQIIIDRSMAEKPFWLMQSGSHSELPWRQSDVKSDRLRVEHVFADSEVSFLTRDGHLRFETRGEELVLAATVNALAVINSSTEVVLQIESNGRANAYLDADYADSIGWMTSAFPLRFSELVPEGNDPIKLIERVKDTVRRVPEQGVGYGVLRYLERDLQLVSTPLPRTSFNYLGRVAQVEAGPFHLLDLNQETEMAYRIGLASECEIEAWVSDRGLHVLCSVPEHETGRLFAGQFIDALKNQVTQLTSHTKGEAHDVLAPVDFVASHWSLDAYHSMLAQSDYDRRCIDQMYPLTPLQEGLLFHARRFPNDHTYVEQVDFCLTGISSDRLREGFRALTPQFTMLRAGFVSQSGYSAAVILDDAAIPITEVDISEYDVETRDRTINEICSKEQQNGFDLANPPLMRVTLLTCASESDQGTPTVHVIWTHHHLIMDGWCVNVLMQQLIQNCWATEIHPSSDRGVLDAYYRSLATADHTESRTFWQHYLSGAIQPTLLAPWPQHARKSVNEASRSERAVETLALSPELSLAIGQCAAQHQTTTAQLWRVIWGWLLTQQTQSSDVFFGTVVSGRPATIAGIDRAVGLFINTRPIRFLTEGCHTVGELLKRVTQDAVACRPHESLTLAEIQSLSALPSDQPIFDSLLVFENYPMDERFRGEGTEGADASSWQIGKIRSNESTEYPLTLVIEPSQRGTQLLLQYDSEKYAQSQIESLLQQVHHITQQIVLDKLEKLEMLRLLRPEEQRWLADEWNATGCDFPRETHLHTLVQHQMEARPDAIAIVDASGALTYEALWAASVRLAATVQAHEHFVVGEPVALWLPRDRSAVIGMLAVLLAGAHYVPLDPIYPQNRLAFIVRDSGAFAVITSADMDPIEWEVPQINVIDEAPDSHLVSWSADPASHAAYVIYTSGSTGTPKGCVISHQNTVRLFANDEMEFDFSESDIWIAAHSLCFDFSVWEIFGALTTGGRVVIPAYEDVRNIDRFVSVVVDSSVTVLNQTPEAFYRFSDRVVSNPSTDLSHLRCVIFGGDTLEPSRLKPFVDRMATHSIKLINMYGITETTVHVTYGPLDVECLSETSHQSGSFVGRPLPETTIWVVNESGQLVPPGTVGEIVVGGSGVSLGYRNRPDLTAEKFRPLAVTGEPRCYWSGDLGVILPEQGLVHLGRKDRQVQIRGFRVECGEIMSALASHQSVSQAYVTSVDSGQGAELIAYLVGDEAAAPGRWSAYVEPLLPRYMHPSYYCWLPEIPLTPNGKVDVANLPTPQDALETSDVIGDDTLLQTILASWKSILGHSGIASDSEFFEVGGHSLKALALAERLSDDLRLPFDVADIFDYTTPKQQATHAETLTVSVESPSAVDEFLAGLDDDEIAATLALMSDDA